jgi:hypothetical protein
MKVGRCADPSVREGMSEVRPEKLSSLHQPHLRSPLGSIRGLFSKVISRLVGLFRRQGPQPPLDVAINQK